MTKAENNFCDVCERAVAIYVEKKRRPGQLVRAQLCVGCLRSHAIRHYGYKLSPTGEYKKIKY